MKEKRDMDNTYETINDILENLFREIMDIEQQAIITEEFRDMTNNDMHVIQEIGVEKANNMSSVARALSVTVGSLTTAVNGLVKKGYVKRERSEEDRRVVYVSLTEKGEKAYLHHKKFHRKMVEDVLKGLSEEETQVLGKTLEKLNRWFRKLQESLKVTEKDEK